MKRVAIIQARMGSTRLPGKVLTPLAGRPMLSHQLDRLKRATRLDELVVATTTSTDDDAVVELADREDVRWSRGSEHDVLSRYVHAAREAGAGLVIRVTADCPLIDPDVVDLVVAAALDHSRDVDYASNVLQRTYPRGLDTEALFADTLQRADRMAHETGDREHVTKFILGHRDLFSTSAVVDREDNSDLRWTVDTIEDLTLVRHLYDALGLAERHVTYPELLSYVRAHPHLATINAGVVQK